jgi:hypothetical protein
MKFNSVEEWLKATRTHTCPNKAITPHDDSTALVIGHKCACGETFTINGRDYTTTIKLLPPEKADLLRHAMSSEAGRNTLAQSLV